MQTKYLVIGNSAGGIGSAEALRQVDKEGAVTIVSEEPYPAYSRPLISKYLAKERTLEGMLYRPPDFYDQNNILFLAGKRVTHVELDGRTASLDNDERITWEKLMLCQAGHQLLSFGRPKPPTGIGATAEDINLDAHHQVPIR